MKDEEIKKKLYDYLGIPYEQMETDEKFDYLTLNKGRDGNDYYWYMYGNKNAAINVKTKEIIDDATTIDELFA